jgi:hypothetical protein
MSLLRRVALWVHGEKNRWDLSFDEITAKDIEDINQLLQDAVANCWTIDESSTGTGRQFLFTDASDERMGFVACHATGSVKDIGSHRIPSGILTQHIFLKETAAAVWYTMRAIDKFNWRRQTIVIGVDNSATAYALRNFYSSNLIACGWLSQLHSALHQAQCTLEVVQVTSLDNPADDPSRNATLKTDRLMRGWNAMLSYLNGRRNGCEVPFKGSAADRHPLDDLNMVAEIAIGDSIRCPELKDFAAATCYFNAAENQSSAAAESQSPA